MYNMSTKKLLQTDHISEATLHIVLMACRNMAATKKNQLFDPGFLFTPSDSLHIGQQLIRCLQFDTCLLIGYMHLL